MNSRIASLLLLLLPLTLVSQVELLSSGPMLGYNTMMEVQIWAQTTEAADVRIEYWKTEVPDSIQSSDLIRTEKARAFTAHLTLATEPGTQYNYRLLINDQVVDRPYPLSFKSQDIWKWRRDASDFDFAIGSCMYINEPRYDRPGKPYGNGETILESIHDDEPDFMVWLGDNIYLREVDWNSRTGILHRYTHMRKVPELQPLMASTHHYAIWDDHDFGPNNSDGSYWGKQMAEEAFRLFWSNPNYNVADDGGVNGSFIWADCQFFLLDNRYNRTSSKIKGREILGKKQRQWLYNALLYSDAKFKFICVGGQFLSDVADHENHAEFPEERAEILAFLDRHNIEGVIFLGGDRHSSEISKITTEKGNTFYDITCSALTSGTDDHRDEPNHNRIPGTMIVENNYAIVNVFGSEKERKVSVSFRDVNGKEMLPVMVLNFD